MPRTPRCRAFTRDGERCARTVAEGSDYCWQHSDDDEGGSGGGGGKALKKAAVLVPAALGILEIVKKIIDIIGPYLSAQQRAALRRTVAASDPIEQRAHLVDFLATVKIRNFERLLADTPLASALFDQFPDGERGLNAALSRWSQKRSVVGGRYSKKGFATPRRTGATKQSRGRG